MTVVEPSVTAAEQRLAELDASFEDFCRDHIVPVERFLRGLCGDRELVQEAVQETLITARDKWEQISGYEKPLAWVYKTARYKLMNEQARQRREATTALDEVPSDRLAAPPADSREAQDWLLRCLRRLPARQAAVFALALEGWTDPEIARILGMADNTVRSYKSAARRRLKELAEEGR
ncbi:RNA polymerase sigma factor [Phytohabitans sp. ZYX-F-186]|uniref:RNA polymerase sigma factor n=1 Tax=Phytohabitans maris TaxID=3071409 RepID=A0ABU0ZJJ6_9ACTN|nr:RNA polymerase sigma factor [Phytohabitans sp. ZYX-F-186]MDQ7907230.1 RNA polymerase sigma factor [Phytohabitans sp. ZYX-F-186]